MNDGNVGTAGCAKVVPHMKSTHFSIESLNALHHGSARYVAGLALLTSAMAFGCASTAVVAEKPISPGATRASPISAEASKPLTADELLRVRLDASMQEAEDLRASRGAIASSTIYSLPQARLGATAVAGRLDPAIIQKEVRANFGKFRFCYEQGLKNNAQLTGRVIVRFVIGRDGSVTNVGSNDSDLPDKNVVECIVKAFKTTKFPQPEGGIVTVVYPIMFSPGDDSSSSRPPPAPPPNTELPQLPPPVPVPVAPIKSGASFDDSGKSDSGPIIVIEGSAIRLNGIVVGDVGGIIAANRMTKVDGLFDELKAWREIWKTKHPESPFVGAAGLRVDANTPQIVFKSVFQTIAFAGYQDIFVQSAEDPKQISEFIAQVPGPPSPSSPDPSAPPDPPPVLHMFVARDEVAMLWKKAATIINEERIARNNPTLAANICTSWKTFGRHPKATDTRRDAVILHSDDTLPWQEVAPVARAAESCMREVQQPDGRTERMPVFWTIFSVR